MTVNALSHWPALPEIGQINRSHDSASGRPCALGGSRGTSLSYQPRSRTKSSLAGRCLHQLYQALKTGLVWTAFVWKKQYHLVALSSSVSGGKNYRWTEQNGADFANSFPRTPSGNLSNLYSLECISGARMFSQTGQWSLGFVPNICGYMSSTRYITAKYVSTCSSKWRDNLLLGLPYLLIVNPRFRSSMIIRVEQELYVSFGFKSSWQQREIAAKCSDSILIVLNFYLCTHRLPARG